VRLVTDQEGPVLGSVAGEPRGAGEGLDGGDDGEGGGVGLVLRALDPRGAVGPLPEEGAEGLLEQLLAVADVQEPGVAEPLREARGDEGLAGPHGGDDEEAPRAALEGVGDAGEGLLLVGPEGEPAVRRGRGSGERLGAG
jgi:hypothetical protein